MSDHEIETSRELRENQTWAWVQPANVNELLYRLALARDLTLPTRELENLCAAAVTEITKLLRLIDERENLLQEFVDDTSYQAVPLGQSVECLQCGTPKGARHSPSACGDPCVVGKAEALLRHMEA